MMLSLRFLANLENFQTTILVNLPWSASAIISLKAGRLSVRALFASSMYSFATRQLRWAAYRRSALSCAEMDSSISCESEETRA